LQSAASLLNQKIKNIEKYLGIFHTYKQDIKRPPNQVHFFKRWLTSLAIQPKTEVFINVKAVNAGVANGTNQCIELLLQFLV
jgi:hypothetical protein